MASDSVVPPGVWVDDSDEDDPVLRQADGTIVDTWREECPYPPRLDGPSKTITSGCCKWNCSREIDPVRQWKLSPTDIALMDKWDA